jgi:hypothetical protein
MKVNSHNSIPTILGIIIGLLVVIVALLTAGFYWYKHRPVDLTSLPKRVRWQYEQYQGLFFSSLINQ